MKILVLCVMLHELAAEMVPSGQWREELAEPNVSRDREELFESPNFAYEDKRPYRFDGLLEQVKRIVSPEEFPPQPRLITRSSCTCETQYEIRDLGEGHYPRYLTASRCKPKACQSKFNSCRLLHYMVHVLTQRDPSGLEARYQEENALAETPLPESLRHEWQLKPMSIAVACVPSPGSRRI